MYSDILFKKISYIHRAHLYIHIQTHIPPATPVSVHTFRYNLPLLMSDAFFSENKRDMEPANPHQQRANHEHSLFVSVDRAPDPVPVRARFLILIILSLQEPTMNKDNIMS